MATSYFDRTKATETGPFPMGTPPFALLERGAGPYFEAARLRVEEMLDRYPEDDRKALLSRLYARETSDSGDAFFELVVLNLFLDKGYRLVGVEQPLAHTNYVVDFSFETPEGKPFLVEVVSCNPPRESVGPRKLLHELLNTVDALESEQYQVEVVHLQGLPTQAVSKKTARARVAGWLSKLTPDDLQAQAKVFTFAEGCSFTLVPRVREAGGRPGLLAALPKEDYGYKVVDGVRKKLFQKAFKYGPLRVPLVVALNTSAEMGVTLELFDKAVYGPKDPNAMPVEFLGYPGEYVPQQGALLEQGGPLSKVPAVLGFLGVNPLECNYDKGAVYYGKHAAPFDLTALGLPTHRAPELPKPVKSSPRLRHPYLRGLRSKALNGTRNGRESASMEMR
jgi:hypothetical protein